MKFKQYLLTNFDAINPKLDDDFEIEIYNNKKIKLDISNQLYYYYLDKPKDIIIIQIRTYDKIYHDI